LNVPRVFDQKHYEKLNASRAAVVSALITELKEPLGLHTALDVGCGLGYFSGLLRSFALDVTAVDGRPENTQEAARRNPGVKFRTYNAEDPAIRTLGTFDLVFCFGLLYHLENPLLAIRHLHSMARQLVLLEAVVFPGDEPVMALVDEVSTEDQGLGHFAFYPTEACLVKMLYRAGFPHVYRLAKMPDHSEYHSSANSRKIRTMLSASRMPISSDSLLSVGEPSTAIRPWDPADSPAISNTLGRLKHFVAKPLPQKIESMKRLLTRNER
jgi:SAM-dependent methyltransferase